MILDILLKMVEFAIIEAKDKLHGSLVDYNMLIYSPVFISALLNV